MQCPIYGVCTDPRILLGAIGCVGFVFGLFSAVWPRRSIELYQGIMERFNWKAAPIDDAREMRNTVFLGLFLVLLSVVLIVSTVLKF